MDDATIGGPVESVCGDIRRIIPMLSDIGREMNPSKSEFSNVSCDNFQSVMLAIESALPGVKASEREDLDIHGTPIYINGSHTGVLKEVEHLSAMFSRQESIDAHTAFFLLWNCLSMPRLLFNLRSSTCYTQNRNSSTRHCVKPHPRSAKASSAIPGGNSQHFASHKVVLASPRQ